MYVCVATDTVVYVTAFWFETLLVSLLEAEAEEEDDDDEVVVVYGQISEAYSHQV